MLESCVGEGKTKGQRFGGLSSKKEELLFFLSGFLLDLNDLLSLSGRSVAHKVGDSVVLLSTGRETTTGSHLLEKLREKILEAFFLFRQQHHQSFLFFCFEEKKKEDTYSWSQQLQ